MTNNAARFLETLRRRADKFGKPSGASKTLVCARGHAVLWLVASPRGLVPVAKRPDGGLRVRAGDGEPMTLEQWPVGEHLPMAGCKCHGAVEVSVYQARTWVTARSHKFTHKMG